MSDVPVSDAELFPNTSQLCYLNTLNEVDKENVRAWKHIVNALQDRLTIHVDGTVSIRGILSPMQLRAVAALAAFSQSSHWIRRGSAMFDLWLCREQT